MGYFACIGAVYAYLLIFLRNDILILGNLVVAIID